VSVTCGRHGSGDVSTYAGFWWESPKERVHVEDQGVDGRTESEWILGRLAEEGVDPPGSA
jgi:hypothetical protein